MRQTFLVDDEAERVVFMVEQIGERRPQTGRENYGRNIADACAGRALFDGGEGSGRDSGALGDQRHWQTAPQTRRADVGAKFAHGVDHADIFCHKRKY